jgi:hypothetical protein
MAFFFNYVAFSLSLMVVYKEIEEKLRKNACHFRINTEKRREKRRNDRK